MEPETLARHAEILRICRVISNMTIEEEIAGLHELLTSLGNANPSEFPLESISPDFLYLNDIFC